MSLVKNSAAHSNGASKPEPSRHQVGKAAQRAHEPVQRPAQKTDRIDRTTPYLSLTLDVGFLVGVQVGATLADGRLYGSVGEFSGIVPGFGASIEGGVVVPNPGRTAGDVITGASVNAAGGFVVGAQTSFNSAGYQIGGGLTSPSFGGGFVDTSGPKQR